MKKSRTSINKKRAKNKASPLRTNTKSTKIKKMPQNSSNNKLANKSSNRQKTNKESILNESSGNDKLKKNSIKTAIVLKITFFIAIILIFIYLLFNLEIFNLVRIEVKGNTKYTDQQIMQNSSLKIGENVFKQLFRSDSNNVNLSYIAKSRLHYSMPNVIIIDVEERYPMYMALDSNTGNYYKIDNEGYLLEQCELESKRDELLVEGFTFGDNAKAGEKINEVYIEKLEIYNSIKKEFENFKIEGNITKVNFSNSLTIVTLDDKLNIEFANDSNLSYKVSFLKGIMQKNQNNMEGTIDMSVDNPVYSEYD